jgi:hypothetical protein
MRTALPEDCSHEVGTMCFRGFCIRFAMVNVICLCIYAGWGGSAAVAQCRWVITPSANVRSNDNRLLSVSVWSAADVWAVGNYNDLTEFGHTLAEHWDGQEWTLANPPLSDSTLTGVTEVAPNDVWAVGLYNGSSTLAEHWDGTQWATIATPNASNYYNVFLGVSALSDHDIWAVGFYDASYTNPQLTLIEHWDGRKWSIVPSPNPSTNADVLYAVSAASPDDVWATGYYTAANGLFIPLLEHWNGRRWSVVSTPPVPLSFGAELSGIAAISRRDVLAVGAYQSQSGQLSLAERWNGAFWSVLPSPNPGDDRSSLFSYPIGIAATSARDAWIAGYSMDEARYRTLVMHWNGQRWSLVPSPNPTTADSFLDAIGADAAGDVWAVGYYFSNSGTKTLAMEWQCR